MRIVFKDQKLQDHFQREGYCIVNLLNPEEVTALHNIYQQNRVEEQSGIELTVWSSDVALKKRVSNEAGNVIFSKASLLLCDYKHLYTGYVAKIPGKPNASNLHRDPTLVDESKYQSVGIWCPLIDVGETNGAVRVIPRSNRMFKGYRGFTCFAYDYDTVSNEVMRDYGRVVPLKAGQALVYDSALLHFSPEVNSLPCRIACNCIAVPHESTTIHYHLNRAENILELHEITADFMAEYYPKYFTSGRLDVEPVETDKYTPPILVTFEEFRRQYYEQNPRLLGWIKRIFQQPMAH